MTNKTKYLIAFLIFFTGVAAAFIGIAVRNHREPPCADLDDQYVELDMEDKFWDAFAATDAAWAAAGFAPAHIEQLNYKFVEDLVCGGISANGCASGIDSECAHFELRKNLSFETHERLVIHEVLHIYSGLVLGDGDRGHLNPQVWNPSLTSIEAKATCFLQGRRCP